jgi:hypothetical protein
MASLEYIPETATMMSATTWYLQYEEAKEWLQIKGLACLHGS